MDIRTRPICFAGIFKQNIYKYQAGNKIIANILFLATILFIDNGNQTPDETVQQILLFLGGIK